MTQLERITPAAGQANGGTIGNEQGKHTIADPVYPFYSRVTDKAPARFLSLAELVELVDEPTIGPKMQAAALTPFNAPAKTKEAAESAEYYALLIDHDDDNMSADQIRAKYDALKVCYLAFTTASHQQEKAGIKANRWKVVLFFSRPVTFARYTEIANGAALLLGTDKAQARAQQVFYAPNIIEAAAPYESIDATHLPRLNPLNDSDPFVVDCLQAYQADQEAKAEQAKQAAPKPRPKAISTEQAGVINKVNAQFDLEGELQLNGYRRVGRHYLSPQSSTGNPGVHILTGDDGRERAYSHHGETDPLSSLNHNGHALDVFDVICVLHYAGDVSKAVAELAAKVDPEGQKQRQRDYMAANESPEALKPVEAGAEWPDVVTLDVEPPRPVPVQDWPPVIGEYALALAGETETPPELPALLLLGTLSAAAQSLADVQVKTGYREPINIYTAVALPPATRKSGVFKRATKPLIKWEADQRAKVEEERKAAESRLKTHKERVSHLRKQAAKAKDDSEAAELADQIAELEASEPQIPQEPRLFTSDVTTEHLATMMHNHNGVMAGMSPEGGIFETMAGRYNQGTPNIDLYLMAHAGDPVRVDRGSKAAVVLDNPRLSMALAVQPDVLDAMSTKPGFKGRGLLGRFLYALPPSNLGSRTGEGQPADPFVEQAYQERILELIDAAQRIEQPATLHLSDDAREVWQDCWHSVEAELGAYGLFEHCTDWAGKLPGAVARIAALFHFARYGAAGIKGQVSAEDMRAAVSTGNALASHALAVFGLMGADPDIEGAKVIARWINRQHLAEFTARDAHKNHKSRFPHAADIDRPLEVLAERGYIRALPTPEGQPGRPSRRFAVNPEALK